MDFNALYTKVINKTSIVFDDFYYIKFYVNIVDSIISISDQYVKDYDYICIKCRKISRQDWNFIYDQQEEINRQKLLMAFSIVDMNFLALQFENSYLTVDSIDKIFKLHPILLNHIVVLINQYSINRDVTPRDSLLAQFKRLYNSERGIVLKYKQIGEYLHLCSFWEKLGLNYFDLQKLPYETYENLLTLIGIQTEIKNDQIRSLNQKSKHKSGGKFR